MPRATSLDSCRGLSLASPSATFASACANSPACRRASRRPTGQGVAKTREASCGALGRAQTGIVQFPDLAVSHAKSWAPLPDHYGGLGRWDLAGRAGPQRLVRSSRPGGQGPPCRCPRPDLQRLADRGRQIALPPTPAALRVAAPEAGLAEAALEALLDSIARLPDALLCSGADANRPGDRFADRHRSLAEKFQIPFARLRPPIQGSDWNDVLRACAERKGARP